MATITTNTRNTLRPSVVVTATTSGAESVDLAVGTDSADYSGYDTETIVTLTRWSLGSVRFDISEVARRVMPWSSSVDVSAVVAHYRACDELACVLRAGGNIVRVIRGAERKRWNDINTSNLFLVRSSRLTKYDGYPLSVVVSCGFQDGQSNAVEISDDNENTLTLTQDGKLSVVEVDCRFGIEDVKSIELAYSDTKIEVDEGCVPDKPYYIRWVNSLGGYECRMYRGGERKDEREERTFEPYPFGAEYVTQPWGIEAKREQLIWHECESEEETEICREIASSEIVQRYDTESGTWKDIHLDKVEITSGNGSRATIELTIIEKIA